MASQEEKNLLGTKVTYFPSRISKINGSWYEDKKVSGTKQISLDSEDSFEIENEMSINMFERIKALHIYFTHDPHFNFVFIFFLVILSTLIVVYRLLVGLLIGQRSIPNKEEEDIVKRQLTLSDPGYLNEQQVQGGRGGVGHHAFRPPRYDS